MAGSKSDLARRSGEQLGTGGIGYTGCCRVRLPCVTECLIWLAYLGCAGRLYPLGIDITDN